ncbi:hypothetical protein PMIN06_004840 [Paraphaeosphaeria minitans]
MITRSNNNPSGNVNSRFSYPSASASRLVPYKIFPEHLVAIRAQLQHSRPLIPNTWSQVFNFPSRQEDIFDYEEPRTDFQPRMCGLQLPYQYKLSHTRLENMTRQSIYTDRRSSRLQAINT